MLRVARNARDGPRHTRRPRARTARAPASPRRRVRAACRRARRPRRGAASRRPPAPACGGCRDGRRRARARRRPSQRTSSRFSSAAATRTTRPSSASRQSPSRSTVPRSRKRPISSPPATVVRSRLFCRSSNGSTSSASCGDCGATRFAGRSSIAQFAFTLEQEIPLRHRQHARRLAGQELSVGAHFVRLGIDVDPRQERRCSSCRACRSCACS